MRKLRTSRLMEYSFEVRTITTAEDTGMRDVVCHGAFLPEAQHAGDAIDLGRAAVAGIAGRGFKGERGVSA